MNYFQRTPIPYRYVLFTALVLATLFLLQAYMHHYVYSELKDMGEFRWLREAPVPYLNFFFWALLTPLVYSIYTRWSFDRKPVGRNVLVHLLFALLIGAFHEVITSTIYYSILHFQGDFDFSDPEYRSWAVQALPPAILSRFMEYWILMVVLIALDNARQMREKHMQLLELKNELQSTHLSALKKQLQPHFLFNTLNTVSALMDEDVNGARTVLSRLGQLLRVTLDTEMRDTVSLRRELDYIRNYLGIEGVRFRDRLKVDLDIPEELESAEVPSMVLQPLVENAIKHGPGATSEGVTIRVSARSGGGRLVLSVSDNGKGCTDLNKAMTASGIGLRNVRERLRLLYDDAATMRLEAPGGRGFEVIIDLPLVPHTNAQ